MPTSKGFGKNWSTAIFADLHRRGTVRRVLDIGVGRGTYSMRLRASYPGVEWIGVEAWEPYVETYGLREKYDRLLVQDAREIDYGELGPFDVAILGDVVEHMSKADALALLGKLLTVTQYVLVCMPILYLPQDAFEGNPYEIHRKPDWSHEEAMLSLPRVRAWYVEGQNGLYWLLGRNGDEAALREAVAALPAEATASAAKCGTGRISLSLRACLTLRLAGVRLGRPFRRWLKAALPESVKAALRRLRSR